MMMTAKATMMTLTPMPGETEIIGAVSAPPSAARNTPAHEGQHEHPVDVHAHGLRSSRGHG